MTSLDAFLFRCPAAVTFGVGAAARIGTEVRALGERALIVTDDVVSRLDGFVAICTSLAEAGVEHRVLPLAEPEVPIASLERLGREAAEWRPDVIIGVGGGSCMDTAKLAALLATHPGPVEKYYGENAVPGPVLPVVAVPTTSGTGSEVSPVAVVTDPDRAMKVGISSPYLIPARALVDPALTLGCPASVTAHSGLDALTHAVEAMTARAQQPADLVASQRLFNGRMSLTDHFARQAVALVIANLRQAVATPHDIEARSAMSQASLLAGLAFASAGTALAHALQYAIGARSHAPHGLGVALLLPAVMTFNQHAAAEAFGVLAADLGVDAPVDRPAAGVVEVARQLLADLKVPTTLRELGIESGQIGEMAQDAASIARLVDNNPRPPSVADLEDILRSCL